MEKSVCACVLQSIIPKKVLKFIFCKLKSITFLLILEIWPSHPDVKLVQYIQARSNEDGNGDAKVVEENLYSDDEEVKPAAKVVKKAVESQSGDSSDSESDEEEEEDDDEVVSLASNKFAALEDDA